MSKEQSKPPPPPPPRNVKGSVDNTKPNNSKGGKRSR